MSDLKKLALRGMLWTLIGYGGSQILRFGGNLILTRLLFPEFFGLMAIVSIFLGGLALFSDVGIGVSVVQNKRGDEPTFVNTAWTVQVIRGIGLWFLCLLLAYPLATFYQESQLFWLIPIVGLTTILDGFSSTARHTLQRHLDVQKLTLMELITYVIQLVVMLIWALISPTIWALAIGSLVSSLAKMIWSFYLIPGYSNRFVWDRSALDDLFSIGRWVFIATALAFSAEQVDRLLLGKLFSLELLGVYGIALMLSDIPRQITIALSGRVIFPTLSKLVDLPRSELRAKILKNRRSLLLVLTFIMLILISFGDQMILFLYDERYAAAAWMLPILAIGIWPRLLCSTVEPALVALGKVHYAATGNFVRLVFTVVGILVGYAWLGILGVVIAVALNDLFYYLVMAYGLQREGVGCLGQDIKVTGLLAMGLFIIIASRLALGLNFPSIA